MAVIPFPPPPPPPDDLPPADPNASHYDGIPAFDVHELNEEQEATLAMMGCSTADIVDHMIGLYYIDMNTGDEHRSSIAPSHILRHHQPVVLHRGRKRVVLYNGDIRTLDLQVVDAG